MPSNIISYDPNEVTLTIDGQPVSGFAEGSFVTVKRDAETWKAKAGIDGQVTRSLSHSELGKVTFTLTQFADFNVDMQNLFIDDKKKKKPIDVEVKYGKSVWSGTGWIDKLPDVQFGNDAGTRAWSVSVANLKFAEKSEA
ncbi:MAG TPA: hypothetical protein PKW95_20525 [bacterium]|nr:hypothetical protein [bacterium]